MLLSIQRDAVASAEENAADSAAKPRENVTSHCVAVCWHAKPWFKIQRLGAKVKTTTRALHNRTLPPRATFNHSCTSPPAAAAHFEFDAAVTQRRESERATETHAVSPRQQCVAAPSRGVCDRREALRSLPIEAFVAVKYA
jgi:hypothetical protein